MLTTRCDQSNNDNNTYDDIYGYVIMAQTHFESSPVHLINADTVPDGCQPPYQAKLLVL